MRLKLTNFSGSTATIDVEGSDSLVKFTVTDKNTSNGSGNGSGSTNGTGTGIGSGTQNGETNNNGNKINIGNSSKENVKNGVLPQTGDANIEIPILMVICALVGVVLLIKIKLINKKIEKSI